MGKIKLKKNEKRKAKQYHTQVDQDYRNMERMSGSESNLLLKYIIKKTRKDKLCNVDQL